MHEVPVLVRVLSDLDALAASLVENLQRQDLNAIEEAEGFRRLIEEFKLTQETVAQAVGKSRSHVANTIRLLNLPEGAITALRDGSITAGHARALLSFADPHAALRIVIDRGLNVRQTEALTTTPDRSSTSARERAGAIEDPDTRALERELTDKIGLKVELVSRGKSGTVKIHYRTLDQLDQLIVSLSR